MEKFLKIAALLLVAVMVLGVFSACKNKPTNEPDVTTNKPADSTPTTNPGGDNPPEAELTAEDVLKKAIESECAYVGGLFPVFDFKSVSVSTDVLGDMGIAFDIDGKLYLALGDQKYSIAIKDLADKFQTSAFGTKGANVLGLDEETEAQLLEIFKSMNEVAESKEVKEDDIPEALKDVKLELNKEDADKYVITSSLTKAQMRAVVEKLNEAVEEAYGEMGGMLGENEVAGGEPVSVNELDAAAPVDSAEEEDEDILASFDKEFANVEDTAVVASMTVEVKKDGFVFQSANFIMKDGEGKEDANITVSAERTEGGFKYVLAQKDGEETETYALELKSSAAGKTLALTANDKPQFDIRTDAAEGKFYFEASVRDYASEEEKYVTQALLEGAYVVEPVGIGDDMKNRLTLTIAIPMEDEEIPYAEEEPVAGQTETAPAEATDQEPAVIEIKIVLSPLPFSEGDGFADLLSASAEQVQGLIDTVMGMLGMTEEEPVDVTPEAPLA